VGIAVVHDSNVGMIWHGDVRSLQDALREAAQVPANGKRTASWGASHFSGSILLAVYAPDLAAEYLNIKITAMEISAYLKVASETGGLSSLPKAASIFAGGWDGVESYRRDIFHRRVTDRLLSQQILLSFSNRDLANEMEVYLKAPLTETLGVVRPMDGKWVAVPFKDSDRSICDFESANEAAIYLFNPIQKAEPTEGFTLFVE
jgi:hypothetical protein